MNVRLLKRCRKLLELGLDAREAYLVTSMEVRRWPETRGKPADEDEVWAAVAKAKSLKGALHP